jgi:hypothetical protein
VSGWREWQIAEVVEAPDFQSFLQDQVVQVYDDSSDRSTTLGTAVSAGMVSFLTASTALEFYNGTAWVAVSNTGDITSVTAGTGLTGGGETGDVTLNADFGAIGSAISITASQISDVTSTAAELNILDGVTADANELNILDGAVISTAELNFLDNVSANVQTQLDGKVDEVNGAVTTATVGSAVVRNITISTATPGTADGMDGDVWMVYTP